MDQIIKSNLLGAKFKMNENGVGAGTLVKAISEPFILKSSIKILVMERSGITSQIDFSELSEMITHPDGKSVEYYGW